MLQFLKTWARRLLANLIKPVSMSEPKRASEPVQTREPRTESEPAIASEPHPKSDLPLLWREKFEGLKPTASSEPMHSSEPYLTSEPYSASEPHDESEPEVSSEPCPLSEPFSASEPKPLSEPRAESEPSMASEPAIVSEPYPLSEPEIASEPSSSSEPKSESDQPKYNRSQRRSMERARRRRDKWVTPQGPSPTPIPRTLRNTPPREKKADASPTKEELEQAQMLYDESSELVWAESEFWGEFNFRDSILDQLDRYWVYLERMKWKDPDAYGFYKEVGAVIVPHTTINLTRSKEDDEAGIHKFTEEEMEELRKGIVLPPWFKNHRPGFGCVVYGANSVVEREELRRSKGKHWLWIPKFMYFTKYKSPPPEIQPTTGGDVYKLTIWWDRPQDEKARKERKGGVPTEFAVFISQDGKSIQILKMIDTEFIPIRRKKASHGYKRGKTFTVPKRAWHIPTEFEMWAKSHNLDPQVHLGHLFCEALKFYEWTNYSVVRVAVHKGDLTATFGVNIRRMSYFFRDRDIHLNVKGHRKKMFHMVRAHERHLADGKVVPIKIQFRGENEFEWAGYNVKITVPGRDHFMLSELNIGVVDEYWQEKGEKYLSEPEFGKRITKLLDEGVGGWKKKR
jgi:hypothetical protein